MLFYTFIGGVLLIFAIGLVFLVGLDLRNRLKSNLEKKSSEDLLRVKLTIDAGGFALGVILYLSSDRLSLLLIQSGALPPDVNVILLINGILFYGGLLLAAVALMDAVWSLSASNRRPDIPMQVAEIRPEVSSDNSNSSRSLASSIDVGNRIKIFKGRDIRKHPDGVSVDGSVFKNVLEAERFISNS